MRHLLGNTLVIEDLDSAIALTRQFRPSARLVTLDGEVINTSGAITGGQTDQKKAGSSVVRVNLRRLKRRSGS